MTRFWWVRHGPTHLKTLAGWTDAPADLSDSAQIDWLKNRLPDGALFSSDLLRAVQTAEALGRGAPQQDPAIRETNFGAWEGLSHAEIAEKWPDLSHSVWTHPGHAAPPGGESWNTMAARVQAAITARKEIGGDVIIVAHHGPILAALQLASATPADRVLAFSINNLSVTRLDWLPEAQTWRIGCVNQHL